MSSSEFFGKHLGFYDKITADKIIEGESFFDNNRIEDCRLTWRFAGNLTSLRKSLRFYFQEDKPVNRENKKKSFEQGYYKTHSCGESFKCKVCGRLVVSNGAGTAHRNHCPYCLSSQHLDVEPGDRLADCGGIMEPVAVWVRKNGEWAIIHRCKICGALSSNRVAADDNPMKLMSIAMKPVSFPPFPLEYIQEMTELMGVNSELKW